MKISEEERKERAREYMRKARAENPEKHRELSRQCRLKDVEKARKATREYMRRKRAENVEESNRKVREWQRANRDRLLAAKKQDRIDNPSKYIERAKRWRNNNVEKCREYARARRKTHPHEQRIYTRLARARRRGASGSCTKAKLTERIAFYGDSCAYCGSKYEHIDHVIPVARGGTNWPANLRPSCRSCNLEKSDKTLAEWQDYRQLSNQ